MGLDNSRRQVYLLCRPIFSGNNAQVRKLKKVKELVEKSKTSLRPLLEDIGEAKLVEILRNLLENRIFESELRAKVEFPDLFRPSPFRDAQREASEIDAARSTAEALEEIAHGDGDGESPEADEIGSSEPEEAESETPAAELEPIASTYLVLSTSVADLMPDRSTSREATPAGEASFSIPVVPSLPDPASHP
jgi:hypothetical protein